MHESAVACKRDSKKSQNVSREICNTLFSFLKMQQSQSTHDNNSCQVSYIISRQ